MYHITIGVGCGAHQSLVNRICLSETWIFQIVACSVKAAILVLGVADWNRW